MGHTMQTQKRARGTTRCINPHQARNLRAAFDHAAAIGKPLNTHITIHWSATADMAADVPDRIQKLIERMRHWLQRRSIPACHIWAQEPSARRYENRDVPHLHMLVHVPHIWRVAFDAMVPVWIGGLGADNAVRIQGLSLQHWRWRDYLVKAVNPHTRDEELQRIAQHKRAAESRGVVEGKRCGLSQNTLGPAAREKWLQSHQAQHKLKAA